MLKGHIEIELHNHKTGSREKIEQDNLITNAVTKISNNLIGRNQAATTFMPLTTNALGGVMLFTDPLTENANNLAFPTSNLIVGFAGQTVNTTSKFMGSINSLETGPIEDGFMTVWDFSTAQANGLLSSMALTNYRVGTGSLFNPVASYGSFGNGQSVIGRTEDYVISTGGLNIYHKDLPLKDYLVNFTPSVNGSAIEATSDQIEQQSGKTYSSSTQWMNGNDGYIYYLRNTSGNIEIERFDDSDFTYDGVRLLGTNYPNNYNFCNNIYVQNSIIYVFNWSSTSTHSIQVSAWEWDDESITLNHLFSYSIEDESFALSSDNNYQYRKVFVGKDGGIIICAPLTQSTYGAQKVIVVQSRPLDMGEYITGENVIFNDIQLAPSSIMECRYNYDGIVSHAFTASNNLNEYITSNYLGTICNFSQPFEKTNTSSMKVKYSLINR